MSANELETWLAPRRAEIERWLVGRFGDAWPSAFVEPLRYPLITPGKRIRPALCLATHEALGGELGSAVAVAGAIELVHTYSLVHDDLPAMDDAELRRGRPTVHRAFDDATAVLVGDALLTEAFAVLSSCAFSADTRLELVRLLADAAGYRGMVGGQAADIGVGGRVTTEACLIRLHRLKTGALLRASVMMGAVAAGASPRQIELLSAYGEAVGLAFQLADDVLDADEDAGEAGPPSFVKLLGIDETRRRAAALAVEAEECARAAVVDPSALVAIARFTVERTV